MRRVRYLQPVIGSLVLAWVMVQAGCDTLGDGIKDLTTGIAPPTPQEAARFALDQDDPDQRREGIVLLSNSQFGHDEVYVKLYRDYVRNERDAIVRAAAIQALARHGDPEDAQLIAVHLTDEEVQVRRQAAKGLQRLHDPAVVKDLLRVLGDPEEQSDVRSEVAFALGQYPQDAVFQQLVAALDVRELSVNLAAEHSLRILTGEDLGLDAVDWITWHQGAERQGTVFAARRDYFYPTYSRKLSFMEKLAFWTRPTFEQPGQPAGLTPRGQRSTYQDEDKQPDEPTSGN